MQAERSWNVKAKLSRTCTKELYALLFHGVVPEYLKHNTWWLVLLFALVSFIGVVLAAAVAADVTIDELGRRGRPHRQYWPRATRFSLTATRAANANALASGEIELQDLASNVAFNRHTEAWAAMAEWRADVCWFHRLNRMMILKDAELLQQCSVLPIPLD